MSGARGRHEEEDNNTPGFGGELEERRPLERPWLK